MNHWICDDKALVLSLRDLHQKCDGRPPKPKGDLSLVSQKGSNYFLRTDSNPNLPGNCFELTTDRLIIFLYTWCLQ